MSTLSSLATDRAQRGKEIRSQRGNPTATAASAIMRVDSSMLLQVKQMSKQQTCKKKKKEKKRKKLHSWLE